MAKTIAEKIFSNKSGIKCNAGTNVNAKIDFAFADDLTGKNIISNFHKNKVNKKNFKKFAFFFDHMSPCSNVESASVHGSIRLFAKENNSNIFDVGRGISHHVIAESGLAIPGTLLIGTAKFVSTAGALGALGLNVTAEDISNFFGTGTLKCVVPETMKIILSGKLKKTVYPKDVMLSIIGNLGPDYAKGRVIEFSGSFIDSLSLADRFTITAMSSSLNAVSAVLAPNKVVYSYLAEILVKQTKPVYSDIDCKYSEILEFDVSQIGPQIANPHSIYNVTDIKKSVGRKITQAVIAGCANSSLEDIKNAAKILKGHKVKSNVKFYIAPATSEIFKSSLDKGYIRTLSASGAIILPVGYGPSNGIHQGVLCDGDVCISSGDDNSRGVMGNEKSEIYIASSANVAFSAIHGKIGCPAIK
ncbi:MAG: aconitase family protein [Candidatus Omnitrophota bacterium]